MGTGHARQQQGITSTLTGTAWQDSAAGWRLPLIGDVESAQPSHLYRQRELSPKPLRDWLGWLGSGEGMREAGHRRWHAGRLKDGRRHYKQLLTTQKRDLRLGFHGLMAGNLPLQELHRLPATPRAYFTAAGTQQQEISKLHSGILDLGHGAGVRGPGRAGLRACRQHGLPVPAVWRDAGGTQMGMLILLFQMA